MIRTCRRQMINSGLCHIFKQRVINHSPVKSLQDFVVKTSLIGPCVYVSTKISVHKNSCFNNSYKLQAFSSYCKLPLPVFPHCCYNIEVTYSKPWFWSPHWLAEEYYPKEVSFDNLYTLHKQKQYWSASVTHCFLCRKWFTVHLHHEY